MKPFRILHQATNTTRNPSNFNLRNLRRLYSAQPQPHPHPGTASSDSDDNTNCASAAAAAQAQDSVSATTFRYSPALSGGQSATWDHKYRRRADRVIFGREAVEEEEEEGGGGGESEKVSDLEEESRQRVLARALLEAALEEQDEDHVVREEDQMSLAVGIIGAPNAGKSALTNYLVGTKVAAVSRKTNTTTHEVLGVMTKGNTQVQIHPQESLGAHLVHKVLPARAGCFFDTPGLMLNCSGFPHKDLKARVQSAWSAVNLYDVLIVIFDVHRHLARPDTRVMKLIERMGSQVHPKQKRILCMNKVDLVEKKKDLLKAAEQFKDLPGYERYFMISGLKGAGVKDLCQYLIEQAVQRPWDEDPMVMSEEVMKSISLEVVREKLLNYVHQEIPYTIEHRLIDWKELRDGSLRIEQHLITHKQSQRKILVGKNGSKIGTIGVEANEELRSIFKRDVHLILQVRVK